jgi:hypothetical protein
MTIKRNHAADKRAASLKLKPRPRQTSGYMSEFTFGPKLTDAEQFDCERRAHLQALKHRSEHR